MGVPKFYRWISERYPCLSEIVSDRQIPEFDNLYLDMNGIIHGCTHPNDEDVSFRISEEQIFRDIFHYIDTLFSIVEPKKVFFMAIDGVAPRAKMNQQRARRFMSAKNAELAVKVAKSKGQEIPEEKRFDPNCITPGTEFMARLHEQLQYFVKMKVSTDAAWQGLRIYLSGHNCPGEGEHKIMDFIRSERSRPDYDANTRHCLYGLDADLIMLGLCTHEPHFSLLREEVKFGRPPKYKQKGSGAQKTGGVDNITFHLLHLSLLREYLSWEFRSIEDKLSFAYNMESVIDDWVLMGFLIGNDFIPHLPHVHIHEDALPVLYKTYMEVLPQLDGYLNENGILNLTRFEKFLKVFSRIDRQSFVETMDDEIYLASKRHDAGGAAGSGGSSSRVAVEGKSSWKSKSRQKHSMITLDEDDDGGELDLHPYSDSDMENESDEEGNDETNPTVPLKAKGAFDSDSEEEGQEGSSEEAKSREEVKFELPSASQLLADGLPPSDDDNGNEDAMHFAVGVLDEEDYENDYEIAWTRTVNRAFKNHKRDYYKNKLKYENISKEELREQAEGYIRALQWNLHYYYHGCCSWNWFYPHHYAPYISDVCDFANMEMDFELSKPFLPFEQLMAVLPAGSAECLPAPLRELMFEAQSPILDFFPRDFATDLNGKKNDWEAVVLIPFINEDRLLKGIALKQSMLTDEEKRRNSHGPHLLFTTDSSNVSLLKSSLPNAFPDIQNCIAKVTEVDMDEFRISRSRIVHGLLSGVRLDVLFPGFPTMKHIPHTAELLFANICVFQMASRKQSMILKVGERPEFDKDMLEVAFDLIDKEVHVDWPVLKRALVHSIWTSEKKYTKEGEDVICEKLTEDEQSIYDDYVATARKREFERNGIEVNANAEGANKAVALVRRMLGVQYGVKKRKVIAERQWCPVDDLRPVSINLVVQGVLEDSRRDGAEMTLEEAYPVNSTVFIISSSSKYYGFGVVIRENNLLAKSSLTVSCSTPLMEVDLSDLVRDYDRLALPWFSLFELSKRTSLSRDVAARITGCVFMNTCDRPTTATEAVYSTDRLGIGLELKFSKRNQLVPDYARRTKEGYWQYSFKAIILIQQYQQKFPEIFKCMQKRSGSDERVSFFADDVWPQLTSEERQQRVKELGDFLQSLPTASMARETADGHYAESRIISEIERRTQLVCAAISKDSANIRHKRLALKPSAVYRDELNKGSTIPDENTNYELLDRVVCVRKTRNAPFGQRGTVVGIIGDSIETQKIDVLFDTPFFGGRTIRSERASGARLSASVLINLTYGMRARGELSNDALHLDSSLRTPAGNNRNTNGGNNNRMQKTMGSWTGKDNGKSAGRIQAGLEWPTDVSAIGSSSQVTPWIPRTLRVEASSKMASSEGDTMTMTRKHEDASSSSRKSLRKPHERIQTENVIDYGKKEKVTSETTGYGRPPTHLIEENVRESTNRTEYEINTQATRIIKELEQKLSEKKVKTGVGTSVIETTHVDEEDDKSTVRSENEMRSEEMINDILKKLMVPFEDMNVENQPKVDDKTLQNELEEVHEANEVMKLLNRLSGDSGLNNVQAIEKSPSESWKTAKTLPPSAPKMSPIQQKLISGSKQQHNQPTNSAIENSANTPIGNKNNLGKKLSSKSTKGDKQQAGLPEAPFGVSSPHPSDKLFALPGGVSASYGGALSMSARTPLESSGGPSYDFFDPWTRSPGRTPLMATASPAPAYLFTMPPPSRQSSGSGGAPGPFAAPPPRSQPSVLQRSREQQNESLPTSVFSLFDRFDSGVFGFGDDQSRSIFHPVNPSSDFIQTGTQNQQNPLFRTPKFPQKYHSASKIPPQSHFSPSTIRFPTPQTPPPNHLFFSNSPNSINSSFQSPSNAAEIFTGVAGGIRGVSSLASGATGASNKNIDKKKDESNISSSKNVANDNNNDKTDNNNGKSDTKNSSDKSARRNLAASSNNNNNSFTADPIKSFIDTIATQQQLEKLDLSSVFPPMRHESSNHNNNSSNNKNDIKRRHPNQNAQSVMVQHKQGFGHRNEPSQRRFDRHQLHLNLAGSATVTTPSSATNPRHYQQWKGASTGDSRGPSGSASTHQASQYHPYHQRVSSSKKPPSDMTPTQVMKRTVNAQTKSNEDEQLQQTTTIALPGSQKPGDGSNSNNTDNNNGNKKSSGNNRTGNNNNNNGKLSSKCLSSTSPTSPQASSSSSTKRISPTKTANQHYNAGGAKSTAAGSATAGGTASKRGARGARKSRVAAKFN